MAYRLDGTFDWPVFSLSVAAIMLILAGTHFNGDVYDIAEDRLAAENGETPFAGGTQVLVKGRLKPAVVAAAAYAALFCAFAIGALLQFYFKTGPWTLLLGLSGALCGFFYSKPPFRWVRRGFGELLIAFSYGWLPVASGFYLQTQRLDPLILPICVPVALTIFNVILINEFPDYPADKKAGKTNLLVRIGKARGALVYALAALTALAAFFYSLRLGAPMEAAAPYLLVMGLTIIVASMVIAKKYESYARLQMICGLSIVINLLTAGSYVWGFLRT